MSDAATLGQLGQILAPDSIITQQTQVFTTEWRNRYSNPCLAVLFPTTVTQIQQIILLCQKNHLGIVPQGGNTSMCAGAIPTNSTPAQVILNLSKLNKIITLDKINGSITVEAGCILLDVAKAAQDKNLYFPLRIGAEGSCQIGGNIATNAGGIHVVKYGTMRDLVLGIEVVLPDGSIVNQLHSLRKNNTYFDLKQLFIGSEGTLGIITKASLKLFQLPQNYVTAMCSVPDLNAATILLQTLAHQHSICAFEVINQLTAKIYNTHFSSNRIDDSQKWLILFEIETADDFNFEWLTDLLEKLEIDLANVSLASNETERQKLWSIRENIPLAEKLDGFAIKHDISLPISNIETFIHTNQKSISNHYPDAQIIIFGHLGDGNLHYNIQFKQRSYAQLQKIEKEINELVYTDVHNYHGSFSAEHGVGYLKKEWLAKYYDPNSYKLAYAIKQLLDPNNILNPGKIF